RELSLYPVRQMPIDGVKITSYKFIQDCLSLRGSRRGRAQWCRRRWMRGRRWQLLRMTGGCRGAIGRGRSRSRRESWHVCRAVAPGLKHAKAKEPKRRQGHDAPASNREPPSAEG